MRKTIIEAVERDKLIVIVRGVERELLIPLADAMYKGGVRLLELTFSADGKISDEETADRIKMLSEHLEGRMHIGAGTVLKESQVELCAKAGGKFIISPDTNERVIKKTVELGLVSMPGALTPTEVQAAHNFGADFVKLFPIDSLGIPYVKAIKAPLSHIKLLAVGGIDLSNIAEYKKTGVCGFGIGSGIIDKKLLSDGDFDGICELARKYVSLSKE